MIKVGEAFQDLVSSETTEIQELNGQIGFRYGNGKGYFVLSRVTVEVTYARDRLVRWLVRLRVEPAALVGMMPLLATLGMAEGEVLNLPPDEQLEITYVAKARALAKVGPDVLRADRLSAMFEAGGGTLLDLDNYENGTLEISDRAESIV